MRTSLRRGMIAAALAATLPGLAATGPALASTARAGAAGPAATVLHATTGGRAAAGCSAGAHTLAPAGSHVYPETGNGGYTSVHTDVHMVYDADRNRFLPGNHVALHRPGDPVPDQLQPGLRAPVHGNTTRRART